MTTKHELVEAEPDRHNCDACAAEAAWCDLADDTEHGGFYCAEHAPDQVERLADSERLDTEERTMTTQTHMATYTIESPDGILLWIGDAESSEHALAQHCADVGDEPGSATAPTLDQVSLEDGQVLARVIRSDAGTLDIRDGADDVEYLDGIDYELQHVETLTGWGCWRSLWRYVDDDGIEHLVARTA